MYSRSRWRGWIESSNRVFQVPTAEEGRKVSETGRAWTDMYEAASQAGGGRVQGQARQRRQTPVLEEERGEMRYAPEDGMDSEGREGADLL
jgi:hypothetical protein